MACGSRNVEARKRCGVVARRGRLSSMWRQRVVVRCARRKLQVAVGQVTSRCISLLVLEHLDFVLLTTVFVAECEGKHRAQP